jgi:hypothetical protein
MDDSTADPAPDPAPAPADRVTGRLQSVLGREPIVAWTRGWVSREVPMHTLLAARTLDFAVVTDRSLSLVTTGFFSRRPRRLVYTASFDKIFVSLETVARGRRLRTASDTTHTLWIELGDTERETAFTAALVARSQTRQP